MDSQQDVQVGAALEYPRIGSLSRREREPTEVSCIIRRHEIAVSIMASQQDVQVGAALEYPRIGFLSLGRGLG
jgi:hypothetical protein